MLPYEISPAIKMQDLATYFIELAGKQPRMNTSVFSFLMNKKSYDGLSAAHKKVIDNLSGRNIAEWAGQNWADIEIPAKKVMQSVSKNKFLTIPEDQVELMKAAAGPAIQRWLDDMNKKGYNGAKLLSDARKLEAKYSKLF
jgi:TRAP-type C4-dicarboxylate transport system substrate-binding protein